MKVVYKLMIKDQHPTVLVIPLHNINTHLIS